MKKILLIFCLLIFYSCKKEVVLLNTQVNENLEHDFILQLNGKNCSYDHDSKILRFTIAESELNNFSARVNFNSNSSFKINGQEVKNNSIHNFGNIGYATPIELEITTNDIINKLTLSFTNLPLTQIISGNTIYNEFKTISRIYFSHPNYTISTQNYLAGIELRGATVLKFPKKSYNFELKTNSSRYGLSDASYALLNRRSLNSWNLDGVFKDKSCFRNKISFEIWNQITTNESDRIQIEFTELYINNEHQGLYLIGESFTGEALNLTHSQAVLYKTAYYDGLNTTFGAYKNAPPNNFSWDGWEQKHPDPKKKINWTPLDKLRKLVVLGSDEKFINEIEEVLDVENIIDYYIFLSFVSAADNNNKNSFFVSRGNPSSLSMLPWDLDASFGRQWDGDDLDIIDPNFSEMKLFDRLLKLNPNSFKERLKNRYKELRSTVISNEKVFSLINNFAKELTTSNIISIENNKWDRVLDITSEANFMIEWGKVYWRILDEYFEKI